VGPSRTRLLCRLLSNTYNPPVPSIKIAVIDDGIDMALAGFTDKIDGGESFYNLGELSGRRGAYNVSFGPHGTLMAKAICSMCPKVKLYIVQLEVLPGTHGQRSFTAKSAAQVSFTLRQHTYPSMPPLNPHDARLSQWKLTRIFSGDQVGGRPGGGHHLHELVHQQQQ
jgi:hypothetical protein